MGRREVHLLRAAIQEGIKFSVASDVLQCAAQVLRQEESAIAAGQRRALAESELRQAVASGDVERIRAAIQLGGAAGVSGYVLSDAMQDLAREEQKSFARQALRTAIAGRVPSALRSALEQARAWGLQDEVSEAEKVLVCMEKSMTVQTRLEAAIEKPNIAELAAAIEAGKKAMVSQSLLDCAQVILQNMQKQDATAEGRSAVQAKLEDAIQTQELEPLRSLIEQAKDFGVDLDIINRAYVVLAQQEQKEKAASSLAAAVSSKDSCAIRSALHVARSLQVPECRLADALTALAQDDRRVGAQSKLELATAGRDADVLRLAIKDARDAGVEAKLIDSAESALNRLEELRTEQSRAESKRWRML